MHHCITRVVWRNKSMKHYLDNSILLQLLECKLSSFSHNWTLDTFVFHSIRLFSCQAQFIKFNTFCNRVESFNFNFNFICLLFLTFLIDRPDYQMVPFVFQVIIRYETAGTLIEKCQKHTRCFPYTSFNYFFSFS